MNKLNIAQLDKGITSRGRLFSLLESLDATFIPPISAIVDLQQHCEKLIENAEIVIASIQGEDVGFVAMYANDLKFNRAFITAIGVAPQHRKKGIATNLLNQAISIAARKGMNTIRLEVNIQNHTAMQFYSDAGFSEPVPPVPASKSNFIVLERTLF